VTAKNEKPDFRRELREQARDHFAAHIARTPEYVVQQVHRDGDIVKCWRCGKPTSSTYMVYVCSAPNCLMVWGDMGECMWQRHYDMIPFLRGSGENLDYFASKAVSDCEVKIGYKELIEEWFTEVKQNDLDAGYDWGEEEDKALADLKDDWRLSETIEQFMWEFHSSPLCRDMDSYPTVTYYTYHYLWRMELLNWFIKQLDEGKVLPYVERDKPRNGIFARLGRLLHLSSR